MNTASALRSAVTPHAAREAGSALRSGTLSFLGHATVGDFVGSTTWVSGAIAGEGSRTRGWVEAPVATLLTHHERRDRHLRASMEVGRYPTMRFDLDGVVTVSSRHDAAEAFDLLLRGRLTIHGVTHAVELPAAVSRRGDTLHVSAAFSLNVCLYRIGGLTRFLGLLRMRPQIEVRVDLCFERTSAQYAA